MYLSFMQTTFIVLSLLGVLPSLALIAVAWATRGQLEPGAKRSFLCMFAWASQYTSYLTFTQFAKWAWMGFVMQIAVLALLQWYYLLAIAVVVYGIYMAAGLLLFPRYEKRYLSRDYNAYLSDGPMGMGY